MRSILKIVKSADLKMMLTKRSFLDNADQHNYEI